MGSRHHMNANDSNAGTATELHNAAAINTDRRALRLGLADSAYIFAPL